MGGWLVGLGGGGRGIGGRGVFSKPGAFSQWASGGALGGHPWGGAPGVWRGDGHPFE